MVNKGYLVDRVKGKEIREPFEGTLLSRQTRGSVVVWKVDVLGKGESLIRFHETFSLPAGSRIKGELVRNRFAEDGSRKTNRGLKAINVKKI